MASEEALTGVIASSDYESVLASDLAVFEAIPAALYVCAADGTIVRFNRRAADLWGRSPRPGDSDERFCGADRLFDTEGNDLPHEDAPMGTALRTGEAQRGKHVVIERPDGSRIIASVHVEVLKDGHGDVQGAISCFQDITESKRAEEELRARQSGLEDFFENAVVAMHWVRGDGIIMRANRAEFELLGYDRDEYIGRHVAEFHVDRATIDDILERLSRGESLNKMEAQLRAKDGSIKDVLISSRGHFREGDLIATRCITMDVTAEKWAESIVSENERRYRELLQALPVAVYTTDADGRIEYYNDAAAEMWGRRPQPEDHWCGSWKLYWADGTPLPHDECPMAMALKGEPPVRGGECILEREDGTRVPFMPFPTPLRDGSGRIAGAVNILVDITPRKRAEEARQKLAALVESSEDAIISKDLNGTITSWNRGAQRLFGYSAEEVLGKRIAILIPPDRLKEEDRILGHIRRGEPVPPHDTVRRRKDGTLVDISLTVSPVKDADGRVIGASKIARDIRKRKKAEKSMARRTEEQAALYDLTDRLHRATSPGEAYDAALDAILRALGCRRASILLFDESGTMRFAAWRGLSEGYRKATEGHSPWTPDTDDPQPICFDDVAEADLDEALRAHIEREGIGALAFIPLVTRGKVVGKFMAYYDSPHAFTRGEMDLAVTIARQLGFAVERMRVEEARRIAVEELRESEARERAHALELQTIMEAAPAIIWVAHDRDCRVIDGNRASYEFLRVPPQANQSLSAPDNERPHNFELFAEKRPLANEQLPVQRAARGEEIRNFEHETRFDDGTSRYLFGNARPLRDDEGNPCGAVGVFVDITERKEAEEQRDWLVKELSHRVKNTLATVVSIAGQSFSDGMDVGDARRSFSARIRALAQTHSRLAEADWSGASLEAIVLDEFAPYIREDGGNLRISGPSVTLQPKCALTLGMTIHELTTNAVKHGALSSENGSVEVSWRIHSREGEFRLRWTESGGPAVAAPRRSGFGRLLLERALTADLGGEVHLDFAEDGLKCAISIPLAENILHTRRRDGRR